MKKRCLAFVLTLCMAFALLTPVAIAAEFVPLNKFVPIAVNKDISNINGGQKVVFAYLDGYYYKVTKNAIHPKYKVPMDGIVRYKADGTGGETSLAYGLSTDSLNHGFIIYKNYLYFVMNDGDYNGGVSDGSNPNGSHSALMRISLDGKERKTVLKVYPYLQNLIIWKGRMIFNTMEGLTSTDMNGGNKKILASGIETRVKNTPNEMIPYTPPPATKLDRTSGYIYWPGGNESNGIFRTMYDGSSSIESVSPALKDRKIWKLYYCDNEEILFDGVTALLYDNHTVVQSNPDNRHRDRMDSGFRNLFATYYKGRYYYHDVYGRLASCLPNGTQKQLITADDCGTGPFIGISDNGVIYCYSSGFTIDLTHEVNSFAPPKGVATSKYQLVSELKTGMEVYFSPDATGDLRIGGASSDKVGLVPIISPVGEKFRLVSGVDNTFYIQSTKTNLYLTRNKERESSWLPGKSLSYQKKQTDVTQRFTFVPAGNGAFYFETVGGSVIACDNTPSAKVRHAIPFSNWCLLTERTSGLPAAPSLTKLTVDGNPVDVDAYTIEGNNYIKIRDMAYLINGTGKNFNVTWDDAKKAINLMSNTPYTAIAGDMTKGNGKTASADLATSKIYVDGVEKSLTAYLIGNSNYFKLRDVMQIFGVGVGYDNATRTASLDTTGAL